MFLSCSSPAGHSKSIEDMDMNVVRLCFQCELERKDGERTHLAPVVSNPIYDKSKQDKSWAKNILYSSMSTLCSFLVDDIWHVSFCLIRGDHNSRAENQSA